MRDSHLSKLSWLGRNIVRQKLHRVVREQRLAGDARIVFDFVRRASRCYPASLSRPAMKPTYGRPAMRWS
jgi:hypothetical protein